MTIKIWDNIEDVHEHAQRAENKSIKFLVKEDTVDEYYKKPSNKGWVGNSIESDWFGIPNNNRKGPDFENLDLDLKVTPIYKTRNGWSAKERLSLNIFDFYDEHQRTFEKASFIEKTSKIEIMYYEYIKDVKVPELIIKKAILFDMKDIPKEDWKIIKQDWKIIVGKIKEGKAEELSDSLTKYLGATTKGGKTEDNLRPQPFSSVKAHQRSFSLKTTYMTMLARQYMGVIGNEEKLIQNVDELNEKSFEDIIISRFAPFIGKSKVELGKQFDVLIPKKNDKASGPILVRKMLNLNNNIENSLEFKKSGISVKIVTAKENTPKTTQGFKLLIPQNNIVIPTELVKENWENSLLRDYISEQRFLLVVFQDTDKGVIFRGVKFWHVPYADIEGDIKSTWIDTVQKFKNGLELEYKVVNRRKGYEVLNNLPKISHNKILHLRPSGKETLYKKDKSLSKKLPFKSKWKNRPIALKHELTDDYLTNQAWWLNPSYMYKQIEDLIQNS